MPTQNKQPNNRQINQVAQNQPNSNKTNKHTPASNN